LSEAVVAEAGAEAAGDAAGKEARQREHRACDGEAARVGGGEAEKTTLPVMLATKTWPSRR
jgi:hypothetical protein